MIVYCAMVVTIERSAFAAQSVAFFSGSPHAKLKSKKQQACFTTPRYANHNLPANFLSVISATC